MPPSVIRSADNPSLKRVGAVRAGKEPEVLLLEGERLVEEARRARMQFELVLVSDEREALADALEQARLPVRRVDSALLARASQLSASPGVLALCAAPPAGALEESALAPDALALVIDGVSDPGNAGALVRSAEASGCAFVAWVSGVSPWNPKALRGSMGSLLRLPIRRFDAPQSARQALERAGFRQLRAATRGGIPMERCDWTGRVALWIGSETGATAGDFEHTQGVTISMAGSVESLNVTVAASLLLFEAARARRSTRGRAP